MKNRKGTVDAVPLNNSKGLPANGKLPQGRSFLNGSELHAQNTTRPRATRRRRRTVRVSAAVELPGQAPGSPLCGDRSAEEVRLGKLYDVWRLLTASPRFKNEELSRFACRVSGHALEALLDEMRAEVINGLGVAQ